MVEDPSISRKIMDIEQELDLFNKKINDVYFWEWIRRKVDIKCMSDSDASESKKNKLNDSRKKYLKRAYLMCKNILVKNPFLANSAEVLFWGWRRRERSGIGTDVLCDPIIDHLERSHLVIEKPVNESHLKPPDHVNVRYLDFIEYFSSLVVKLGLVKVSLSDDERKLLQDIKNRIRSEIGVELDLETIVKRNLIKRKVEKPLYEALIRRIEPEIVIMGIASSGKETFIEVCKDNQVPVVELQHGVMSEYKLAWSFPEERKKRTFPDYFFTFGSYWSSRVELPIPDQNIYDLGFPDHERRIRNCRNIENRENQILFISQPEIGQDLVELAIELKEITEYKVVYKLHPAEIEDWSDRYPQLEKSEVNVASKELYKLFSESSAQVGVYSTALFEGLSFNLTTFLVKLPGVEMVSDLDSYEFVYLVDSAEELSKRLSDIDKGKNEFDSEIFFRRNSLNNIKSAIDRIISESQH